MCSGDKEGKRDKKRRDGKNGGERKKTELWRGGELISIQVEKGCPLYTSTRV